MLVGSKTFFLGTFGHGLLILTIFRMGGVGGAIICTQLPLFIRVLITIQMDPKKNIP